jgi:hypothetical protein
MSAEIKNLKDLQNGEYSLEKLYSDAEDFLPLLGTDYVELYVGNAKQSALYYKTAFGFQSEAYAGLETGLKDRVSYVLKQEKIRLVLTTPLTSFRPAMPRVIWAKPESVCKNKTIIIAFIFMPVVCFLALIPKLFELVTPLQRVSVAGKW